jgi:hypothetical protein
VQALIFSLDGNHQGREEKGGKKEKERKKRRKRKEKGKKKNRKKERVTAPIRSHFVQGQTLGVGGVAPKIIYERTLIAECSLIFRVFPLVPKFAICIVPLPQFQFPIFISIGSSKRNK